MATDLKCWDYSMDAFRMRYGVEALLGGAVINCAAKLSTAIPDTANQG